MDSASPIGVFDSGLGGVSVLKQMIRFLPYEKYIYLGDTARVPYGNKSPEIVREYSRQAARFLIDKDVKMIVVACNSASSVAMDAIAEAAGEIPIIGMIIPAAAAALRSSVSGKIGIIGTRATINSKSYIDGIHSLKDGSKARLFTQACPLFVPIVEEGMLNHEATRIIAEEYIEPLRQKGIDTLILGCTHYPLLSRLLTELLPGVALIDSGEHAAVTALRLLADNRLLQEERNEYIIKPEVDFYVTDLPAVFYEQAQRFLGFAIDKPIKISLGGI